MDNLDMEKGPETELEKELAAQKREKKCYFTGMLTGILFAAALAAAVILARDIAKGRKAEPESPSREAAVFVGDSSEEKLKILQDTINQYYLQDVDAKTLEEGMYTGLLDSLGDPYSVYYTAEQLKEIVEKTSGIYFGIGAYVGTDTTSGYAVITKLINNTPASRSDLMPGDLIYKVDGADMYGLDVSSVVAKIKGEEGTQVTLTVARPGSGTYSYLDITLTRAKINSPTVESEMLDGKIAYIEITEFDTVTLGQFRDALQKAKESGMKGLILDLRGNPGGNLSTVVDIAREILPKGMIVYTEDKYGKREEYTCDGKKELDVPLVVLVDGASASASEILSGAIKDYGIGTLVGTKTFGKGIVQRIIQLTDGSAVKLTISKYYTPNGYNIHDIGIEPDVEIQWDHDLYVNEGRDNQLEEAQRIMGEKIGDK